MSVTEPLPERGLLVPEGVGAGQPGVDRGAVLERLRASVAPVGLSYRPATEHEMSQFRTVRLNASAQQAMSQILQQAGPKAPTLYRAVLPEGAQLVRAVGGTGFRGMAQASTGRISAQALLKPVGVGAAAAIAWPVLAVAATVMVLDHFAQKQQREFQRLIAGMLERQASDRRRHQFARLQAIDLELSEAIARILDGQGIEGSWEHARFKATEELFYFHRLISEFRDRINPVVLHARADYKDLSEALHGARRPGDPFYQDLELARGTIALGHKAALANAAAAALRDPENAYTALRSVLEARLSAVASAEKQLENLTRTLSKVTLTTDHWKWNRGDEVKMQEALHAAMERSHQAASLEPVEFLALPSGEVLQVQKGAGATSKRRSHPQAHEQLGLPT